MSSSHHVGDFSLHFGARRLVDALELGVSLPRPRARERVVFGVDVDHAPRLRGRTEVALRAVVAAWAELGASISVVASSELDELTGRAGHRASVGIDVKRVLCELAVSRRRWLHLHVGDGPFRLDVFDEICTAVRGVAK